VQLHSPPFTLKEMKLEVTYRCGLNCVHCSSDAQPAHPSEMPKDLCLRTLKDAADMGVREVAFSGGEPLLWPSIVEAARTAADAHRMGVTLYTTGNIAGFEEMAVTLKSAGVARLVFSLFSHEAPGHERVTRKSGSYTATVAALRCARKAGLHTEIHFVPMTNNFRDLPSLAALAARLHADKISVLRLVPQGRAALMRNRTLSRVQNIELRRTVQALRAKYGDGFVRTGSPYNFLMLNNTPKCCAAIDRLIIGPDMRLYPCDAFKQIGSTELSGTDLYSSLAEHTLSECWIRSPYLTAIRTYLTTPFEKPCAECGNLETCLSGCLAQKVLAHTTLEKLPDPDCLRSQVGGHAA